MLRRKLYIKSCTLVVIIGLFLPVMVVISGTPAFAQEESRDIQNTPIQEITTHEAIDPAPSNKPKQKSDPDSNPQRRNILPPDLKLENDDESLALLPPTINIENDPGDVAKGQDAHTIDGSSGAFTYNYSLPLPPSRQNLLPSIALQYSSQNNSANSPVGRGWSISIPSIRRINKSGVGSLRQANHTSFESTVSGELEPVTVLTGTQHGTYGARTESGEFLSYTLGANNVWQVVDNAGTVYTYGASTTSRIDEVSANYIYAWHLSEIRDVHDNVVRFEYIKHQGQIYPARIVYTGHGTVDGPTEVLFDLQNSPYESSSSEPGFRVITEKRIHSIRILHNNVLYKKVDFNYTLPSNSHTHLLQEIQETGYDTQGTPTIQNPIEFDYGDVASTSWSGGANWQTAPVAPSWGTRYADVNGDSRIDMVQRSSSGNNNNINLSKVYINSGTNFSESTQWNSALGVLGTNTFYNSTDGPQCLFMTDLNGDGYSDFWKPNTAYINNGATGIGWQSVAWSSTGLGGECLGYKLADVDGDGLDDLLYNTRKRISNTQIYYYQSVFLNTGSSFVYNQAWSNAIVNTLGTVHFYVIRINTALNNYSRNTSAELIDMNNDGYVDVFIPETGLYINTGNPAQGWVFDAQWQPNQQYLPSSKNARLADTDGDGMIDLMNDYWVFSNAGDGMLNNSSAPTGFFHYNNNLQTFYNFSSNPNNEGPNKLAMLDINGDKKSDAIWSDYIVYINQGQEQHAVLKDITLAQGGSVHVEYGTSAQEVNSANLHQNNSSSNITVTKSITLDAGMGAPPVTTHYDYKDAYFYFQNTQERRFAGFGSVTITDPEGNITKNYYHQANTSLVNLGEHDDHISKLGQIYRTEIYDTNQNLYKVETTKWVKFLLGTNRYFVYPENKVVMYYDGQASVQDAQANEYTYDTNHGGRTRELERGAVNANTNGTYTNISTSDDRYTDTEYAVHASAHITKPKRMYVHDGSSLPDAEKKYYFDNLPYGQIANGLVSKESTLITTGVYADTQYTYNQYGLPITVTDPLGNTTTTTYDAYNLYPASITNALGQITQNYYDYSSGTLERTIDANNAEVKTVFDGLDRPISSWQTGNNNQLEKVTENTYHISSLPQYVHTTRYVNANDTIESRVYTDGFARPIQERNDDIATDTLYNNRGLVYKSSLPYVSAGMNYTSPTMNQALITTTTYDVLNRQKSVAHAVGTNTYTYNGFHKTITNAKGIIKEVTHDAFGNIKTVREHNGSQIYTTTYTYNRNNNLVQITDALGNIRTFTYDKRGLRTHMTDVHAPNDAQYAQYSYVYDLVGNRVSSTDPYSTTTTVYDQLNRPAEVNDSSTPNNPDIQYAYDMCGYGVGRVCVVTTPDITTQYAYTRQGLQNYERRTINNTNYTQTTEYDRQGNITKTRYPNNTEISYLYNARGLVGSVIVDRNSGRLRPVVWATITYAPHNQMATIQYANGTTTTHTYDPSHLYRRTLTSTLNSNNVSLQNIEYAYDSVGNVTGIYDQSNTQTSKIALYMYDDLDRMVQAAVVGTGNNQDYVQAYVYNAVGNILVTSDNGQYTYTDQGMNNPHAATNIGTTQLSYDTRGNVTSFGNTQYQYAWNNKMKESNDGTLITRYSYDHNGNRFRRTNNCVNQSSLVCITNGVASHELTIFPSYLLRDSVSEITIQAGGVSLGTVGGSGILYYEHTDHLNSSSVITDGAGNLVQLLDYYPFGQTRINNKNTSYDSKHKYTGHQHDEDTNLTYMLARYYNPEVKRFFSADPASRDKPEQFLEDPQQLNSYSYARNNPLIYVDPDGKKLKIVGSLESGFGKMMASSLLQLSSNLTFKQAGKNIKVKLNSTNGSSLSNSKPVGSELLQNIIQDNNMVKIDVSLNGPHPNRSGTEAPNWYPATNGRGTNSTVYFNPDITPVNIFTQNGVKSEGTPTFIELGHELIHAMHNITGTSFYLKPDINYLGLNGLEYTAAGAEEVRTVGLDKYSDISISENNLRLENNISLRNNY